MRNSFIGLLVSFSFWACGSVDSTQVGDVVAKINQTSITAGDLSKAIGRMSTLPTQDYSSNERKRDLLNELVDQELLVQAAIAEKIYEKSDSVRSALALEYLKQKIGSEHYQPTEDEIRAYFEKNKDQLEKIKASHILIKPEKSGDLASEAAAKKKAEGILAQIKAGANFGSMAQKYSQDESNRASGGNLGLFERKKMVPEFSQAAFALKNVGDISPIVKTSFGYHVIMLTGDQRGLERFRHDITWLIAEEKRRAKAEKLLSELRKNASIKIFDSNIAKAAAKSETHSQN